VGDFRLSARALRCLASSSEVIALVLRQVASSYDEVRAMVQGCWPIKTPDYRERFMPTFHLAFCLTALEQLDEADELRALVQRSLVRWRKMYLREGLVRDVPGWHFTDWDGLNSDACRQQQRGAHAVLNAWYHEACRMLGLPGIDLWKFDEVFWVGAARAYRLVAGGGPSPHATAAAMISLSTPRGLDYLRELAHLRQRVTPYFAAYVAEAVGCVSRVGMREFIRWYYGPIVEQTGTIWERGEDVSARAHSASVGVAALLVDEELRG
jgi:hypothetical protein